MKRGRFSLFLLVFLFACGSSDTKNPADNEAPEAGTVNPSESTDVLGSKVNFTFSFSVQSAVGGETDTLVFPSTYTTPLYVRPNGQVFLRARDFPRLILRICQAEATSSDCNVKVDSDVLENNKADLVFDLCGAGKDHAQCGDNDTTVFSGALSEDGRLFVNAIAVRIRIFVLDTSGPSGSQAADSAGGLINDLPRMTLKVQTGPVVTTGSLSGIGSPVSGLEAILVGGGIVPADMPEMGGENYLVTLTGIFDVDPLALLE